MTENLTYSEAVQQIKSGDIISFFTSHEESFIHRLVAMAILYFTGSRVYHTGIAMWMTTDTGKRRLMLVEAIGTGRRLLNLAHFKSRQMEIHHVPTELNSFNIEFFLLENIGKQRYGFWNLIAISLREFFGLPVRETKGQVCSQLAALAWQAGGMKFNETCISPGKLRNELIKKGIPPAIKINARN